MVDFAEAMKNAAGQGLDLQEVAIQCEGLTDDERPILGQHQVITHDLGERGVLAKLPTKGSPLYENKATGLITLAG